MNPELFKKASALHNDQPIEIRRLMSISSAHTQITTLIQLRHQIMADAKKRCAEIDLWIKNIEEGTFGLRHTMLEHEKDVINLQIGRIQVVEETA